MFWGVLVEPLKYHVVPFTELSAGLYSQKYLRTLHPLNLAIKFGVSSKNWIKYNCLYFVGLHVKKNKEFFKFSKLIYGVIHIIDEVLIPPIDYFIDIWKKVIIWTNHFDTFNLCHMFMLSHLINANKCKEFVNSYLLTFKRPLTLDRTDM